MDLALPGDRCTLPAMIVALRQWGSAGRTRRCFPHSPIPRRVGLLCILLLGALVPMRAHAEAMYRCTGASGEAVFTSKPAGYRGCRRIGSYAAPSRRVPRRAPAVARASFEGVAASVDTSARVLSGRLPMRGAFADVQTSVHTTGRALADAPQPAAPGGKPGGWAYRESRSAATTVASAGPGDRVLRGAVYRVKRADGSVEYTNIPPVGGKGRAVTMLFTYIATCMACDLHSPIHWNSVRLNLQDYASVTRRASVDFGVDEAFLRAIIHAESAFNPHALSIKGAQGLMQLMPATASDMGVLDAFNAEQNIRGGARYLGQLLQTFKGDERLAAAAYNAGPGAVERYKGVPPYAETRVYVARVEELRQRYGKALHRPLASSGAAGGSAVQ
ncbi:lytic transglycosylase domain-containing protein [Dyella ginsengisoli]|uniref:lytic transglycosylase domain-containing protein n=1 Tax=Dyella ginsengisoli TaxID=363848 RepID=UPI00036E52CC